MPNNSTDISKALNASEAKKQLDALIITLNKMYESIKNVNTAIVNNEQVQKKSTEANKAKREALTEVQKLQKKNAEQIEKLNVLNRDAAKQNAKVTLEIQQKKKALKDEVLAEQKVNNAIKQGNAALKIQVKSKADAKKQTSLLRASVEQLDLTTKKGIATEKIYNAQIDKNTAFVKRNSDTQSKAKQSVGGYTEGINKSKVALDGMKGALSAVGVTLGAATIVKGFKAFANNVISNSQIVSDELDILKSNISATFDAIGRAVATGDFKNLAEDIKAAREAAGDYTREQDDLGDTFRSLRIEAAEVEAAVYKLREVYTNTSTDSVTALDAVLEANTLLLGLEERRASVTQDAVSSEFDLIQKTFSLTKEQKGLLVSYIRDFGKAEGEYQSFISGTEEALKRRAKLQEVVEEGATAGVGFVSYTNEARAAQIEIEALNNKELKGYDLIQNAISGISDTQRTRISEAIANVAIQERATQRLINETTRQEAVIRRKGNTEVEVIKAVASAKEQSEESGEGGITGFSQSDLDKRVQSQTKAAEDIATQLLSISQGEYENELAEEEKYLEKINEMRDEAAERDKERDEQSIKDAEQLRDTKIAIANELFTFTQVLGDRKIANLEMEVDSEGEITATAAAEIAKIKKRQAIIDKAQGLFNIGINTAVAVTSALPNIPLSLAIGLLGAAQAAAVIAAPIPQFATGVENWKGGMAIVGEEGVEAIESRNGDVTFTPPTASLMNLKRGDTVITAPQTQKNYGGIDAESKAYLKAIAGKANYKPLTDKGFQNGLRSKSFRNSFEQRLKN